MRALAVFNTICTHFINRWLKRHGSVHLLTGRSYSQGMSVALYAQLRTPRLSTQAFHKANDLCTISSNNSGLPCCVIIRNCENSLKLYALNWLLFCHLTYYSIMHPMRKFPYHSCCADRDLPLNGLSSCNIKCRARKLSAQYPYPLCGLVLSSRNSASKHTHHQNNHCPQILPWRSGKHAWIRCSVAVRLFC